MPAAVPLLVGLAAQSAAVSFGLVAAGSLGFALVGAGAAMLASSLVAPKPPSLGDLDRLASSIGAGRTQQIRQPITAHQYIYGTVKTSGPIVFAHTRADGSGRDDGYLYLVIALAGHRVSAIDEIYLGEDLNTADRFRTRVTTSGDHVVPAAPHEILHEPTRDGLPLEVLQLLSVVDLTTSVPLDNVSPGVPAAGQYSVAGNVFTFNAAEEGHSIRINYETYFRVERVRKHLGAADQAADSDFLSEISDAWTADHRLRGRAYLAIRLTHNAEAFPSGVPNIAAIVDGLDTIYDPRSGLTAWSDNPALCVANWMTSSYGLGLDWEDLDEASVIAAANVCDELVSLAEGGTVKRYTCNGSFSADMAKRDVLTQMLSSMAGVVIHMGGKWFLHAGAPATPTVTLDEDDLRGPLVMVPKRSMRDRFNGVRAVYVNPDANWQPVDAPPLLNSAYVAEDQGEALYRDLRFPFTTSTPLVQRLMKIELERNRRQRIIQFPAKLTAMRLAPWDGVYLDLERYGFDQAQFRVIGWEIAEDGGIDLTLQEDDADVYAWSASEEVEPAVVPGVTVPNPATIGTPASITVTTPTTPTYARIDVSWAAVSSIWLAGYDAEFQDAALDEAWTSYGQVTSPNMGVARSASTDFRARARTAAGVVSAWRTSTAPEMPSDESAASGSGQIDLSWTPGSGAAEVQIFVNTVDTLASATLLDTVSGSSHSHTGLGAGQQRYYWLRSVAADGNFSDETASVNATTS